MNLAKKNSYDVEVGVYRSIFTKSSTLLVGLEIEYMEFFDVRKLIKNYTMYN